MHFGSVCSGIEAASVAWEPLGWRAQWLSEIEAYPRAVLQRHYADLPLHADFTALDPATVPAVDVLVGGTPCQPFARHGKGRGLDDPRGQLALRFVDLAHGLADRTDLPLRYAVWENIPGVLRSRSSYGSDFGCILGRFVGSKAKLDQGKGGWPSAGMVAGPRGRVAWRVLDSQFFGLPQQRPRLYLVFCPRNAADPAAILFERNGCRRRPEAGPGLRENADAGEAGEGAPLGESAQAAPGEDLSKFPYFMGWAGYARQVTAHSPTLTFGDDRAEAGVLDLTGPRVFTPMERERLMGFPDRWTEVEWNGKPAWDAPVGKRTEATGNSMAVPVMRWIGERIQAAEDLRLGTGTGSKSALSLAFA